MISRTVLLVTLCAAVGIGCKPASDHPGAPVPDHAAQDQPVPVPHAKDPLPHPLFWAVEKDGITTYLLGTMHIGVDAEDRLPDAVWKKLDAAKSFAMETDISDPTLASMRERDHGTLHEDLGPEYWHKLEVATTPTLARGMDRLKPLVAVATLSLKNLPRTPPMDGVLLAHAKSEHKAIVYLEPAKREAELLEKWMTVGALKELLDDGDAAAQLTGDMVSAYVAGDEAKILAISAREHADFAKHGHSDAEWEQQMSDLLYGRNASWIEPLERLHAAGGGFVAVGAAHLVGPGSVLELLAAKGYKVSRVAP
jgi:uncharacterized protein YbaP (TraB family)